MAIGCRYFPDQPIPTPTAQLPSRAVVLEVDGQARIVSTTTSTVSEFLREQAVAISGDDEVRPSLMAAIPEAGPNEPPFTVTITRVNESTELIPESIPFQRKIVRSADLSSEESPRLLQAGKAGLREITIRIVYHNGLEVERWPVSVTVIEPAQDEIVMIAAPPAAAEFDVSGILTYLHDGRALVINNPSGDFYQVPIEGQLDGRVFQLSPDGQYLLYTTHKPAQLAVDGFRNELWIADIETTARPQPLNIENVLWAGWDPAAVEMPRIAYSTARTTSTPPGWEASNDLWLLDYSPSAATQASPIRLIDSYATPYGWWGGNYAWSPAGDKLAYAFATEIGLIGMPSRSQIDERQTAENDFAMTRNVLHTFPEYQTDGDWAWVPALSWAPDNLRLAYTEHAPSDTGAGSQFNLAYIDTSSEQNSVLVEEVGGWAQVQWSLTPADSETIAFLRADDPANSLESRYTLWLSNTIGSEGINLYPESDDHGRFGRSSQSLAWGSNENEIAFIFIDQLHILRIDSGEVTQSATDDTIVSAISWAPYGAGLEQP
jgi:hypothetical protein